MIKISNFIYCLNSVTTEEEANALGVLSAITPEFIPGSFSFSVFMQYFGFRRRES